MQAYSVPNFATYVSHDTSSVEVSMIMSISCTYDYLEGHAVVALALLLPFATSVGKISKTSNVNNDLDCHMLLK